MHAQEEIAVPSSNLRLGADRVDAYLPKLKGKKVAMVVNPTSQIGNRSSVDSLLALDIHIVKVFGPEHGFRGEADAGSKVDNSVDSKTGLPIISLYGKNYKPKADDLKDVDIVVFDIQDVGTRFYTYISTLHYVMEACAENNKPLLLLDRPNPNGFSIDGPILDPSFKSFIGMHPIPITHGMTIGEYAKMINGEKWLDNGVQCRLEVVKMENYRHDMEYILPIKPSPNLNTQQSILLYPSLCLFEGTIISQGRGTTFPFTVLGAPALKGKYPFSFTPTSIPGMSTTPLHQNEACYGLDLRNFDTSVFRDGQINLAWLIELYNAYPRKQDFFDNSLSKQIGSFDKLAGTKTLREQIIAGKTESEIRATWKTGLENFKKTREKYLLY
nr:DUF1343 domain-containing protein [Olivibacter sitiensis]